MIGGEADLRRAEQIASERNIGQGGQLSWGRASGGSGGNADYPVQYVRRLSGDEQQDESHYFRIILVIPIMR